MANSERLTIDPEAAEQDVRRMQQSIELLEEMRRKLQQLRETAQTMQGQTRDALVDKSQELLLRINNTMDNMQEAIVCIRRTVRKYEEKDAQLANVIAHGGKGRSF